jgi:hypothetical protein
LVKTGLEFIRDKQNLIFVAFESLADVSAFKVGIERGTVFRESVGPDSLSFTSPEKATMAPIL